VSAKHSRGSRTISRSHRNIPSRSGSIGLRNGLQGSSEGLKLLGSTPKVDNKISALTAYDPCPTPESLRPSRRSSASVDAVRCRDSGLPSV
jgi:hypothetical protein